MLLIIYGLGGGHARTHAPTHPPTHTHTHTDTDTHTQTHTHFGGMKVISRNQERTSLRTPGLKIVLHMHGKSCEAKIKITFRTELKSYAY